MESNDHKQSVKSVFPLGGGPDASCNSFDVWVITLAMEAVDLQISDLIKAVPPGAQQKLNNALLNIAVNRIVEAEGSGFTAQLLGDLVYALQTKNCSQKGALVFTSSAVI